MDGLASTSHVDVVRGQPTEGVAEGQIGQGAVAEVEAVADEYPPAGLPRPLPELVDETALAYARVATEDEVAAWLGLQADEIRQPPDLVVASDERCQCRLRGHVRNHDGRTAPLGRCHCRWVNFSQQCCVVANRPNVRDVAGDGCHPLCRRVRKRPRRSCRAPARPVTARSRR